MVWQGRNDVVLTNKNSRLVFGTDSADAEINGLDVRLSFPIAKGAQVSQLDLDKTVRPLIFSQKWSDKKITTICLDPGHGGKDTGNRVGYGFFAHNEKTYTLALALELREQLKKLGFNVILTRSRDVYVDLPLRPAMANRAGADLFISLHFNSSPTDRGTVRGVETYCITPVGAASSNSQGEGRDYGSTPANRIEQKSLLLAFQMEKSLVQNLHADDREVRRARYAVLRDAVMPAILIEGGYMSHPVEGKRIYDANYRKQMASAIVRGVLNYRNLASPPASPVQTAKTNSISTKAIKK
jgi:N-acetylmuramoyl-L-alanine amidase